MDFPARDINVPNVLTITLLFTPLALVFLLCHGCQRRMMFRNLQDL